MTTYNKYIDTYIKQKTTGAITGGYAFQVDGNSNLNGIVNITNTLNSDKLNITTLATCPTVISTDNSTNIATTAFVKSVISSSGGGGTVDLSPYVLSSVLTTTLNSYLTTTQIIDNLNDYLKVNDATTIYQPKAEMMDFLSKYDASVLYQPKGDMSNYVTNPSLSNTLLGYVTTSQANETYQIKSLVQPYTQLSGAGTNNGYTTSAANEVWGKNNNSGATGYFITNTYAGYTPSNVSGWNSGQGFYFAPVSGVYSINMNIFINSDTLGNKYLLSHYGNTGSLIYSVYVHTALATAAGDKLAPYSTMLKMNEGDYFKVTLSVRNGTSNWWFGNNPLHSSMTITKVS